MVNVTPAEVAETPTPEDPSTPPTDDPTVGEAANITATLTNPLSEDMADTLMVGNNAEVRVQVTDADGKAVANQDVALSTKLVYPTSSTDYTDDFENLTHTVLTTDAKGYATFVFGVKKSVDKDKDAIDAVNTKYVSTHKLTVKVVGKDEVQTSRDIKFAAVNLAAITEVEAHTAVKNNNLDTFQVGTNADGTSATSETRDRNGEVVKFVRSQRVSSDATNHAVTFNTKIGNMGLMLPGVDNGSSTDASDIKEEYTFDTGKYSTYATTTFATAINAVKASELQYATVNFGKLSLSKYSRFFVQAYIVNDPANPVNGGNTPITLIDEGAYVRGEKVTGAFSVQIPVNATSGYLYVVATIQSKGQVNTDVNEGFTVKNIVGVRKKTESSIVGNGPIALEGLTVDWAKDEDATYTINAALPEGNLKDTLDATGKYDKCTYEYKMPAFPRTGNAIITVLNDEKQPIAYYAVPTTNAPKAGSTTEWKNENILVDSPLLMYQISQDEALNQVGDVTSEGNVATVDSKKTGVTHVIGTITSSNPNIKIDASNRLVYSSVHWNPIPNATASTPNATRAGGAALVGQQIVLKAQLTDVNGNPVTTASVPVEFYDVHKNSGNTKIELADGTVDDASIIKVDTETNALGQAELVLVAGKPAQAIGLSAKCGNDNYNLQYRLGNSPDPVTTDYVDLYWVDANILFEADANTDAKANTTFAQAVVDTNDDGSTVDIKPIVGENWLYEVRTNGDVPAGLDGILTGKNTVTIGGLNVQTAVGTDSVGTVTNVENGKANVTSTIAGITKLVNTLTSASVSNSLTFDFGGIALPYVGTGDTTLDKKLTLSVNWTAGVPTAQFIIPTSLKADINVPAGKIPVYVLVQDANGNVIENRKVTLKVTGVGDVVAAETLTDANGIAKFEVTPTGANPGDTSTLTATVDGLSRTYASSIKWIDLDAAGEEFKITKVAYDYTSKTITLTFNNDIYAPSVIKELFTVKYNNIEQIVTDAVVSANKITLSIPGLQSVDAVTEFEVVVAAATKAGIEYNIVSVDAQGLTNADITFLANDTVPTDK